MQTRGTRRQARGFTIIELLVVIGIIGIFSAIVLTGVSASREKGREATALQVMKSLHDIAMVCVNTNAAAYTFCYPGQTVAQSCSGTVIGDTQNGGGGFVCASNPNGRYTSLPTGWLFCDTAATAQATTNCGGDASGPFSGSFRVRAENPVTQRLITCDETGCIASADSD